MSNETELLLLIHARTNAMMDSAGKRTGPELRALENNVRELRDLVERAERRAKQAEDLKRSDAEPVRWVGDIDSFCEDLVFHAKALGRSVRGEFNEVPIVAGPDSSDRALAESYWHRRHP